MLFFFRLFFCFPSVRGHWHCRNQSEPDEALIATNNIDEEEKLVWWKRKVEEMLTEMEKSERLLLRSSWAESEMALKWKTHKAIADECLECLLDFVTRRCLIEAPFKRAEKSFLHHMKSGEKTFLGERLSLVPMSRPNSTLKAATNKLEIKWKANRFAWNLRAPCERQNNTQIKIES